MTFEELSSQRKLLQDFCERHEPSLLPLMRDGDRGFKLTDSEKDRPEGRIHLTTTATCIESLLVCRSAGYSKDIDAEQLVRAFCAHAVARDHKEWRSEESASIYCRCRSLPLIIDHLDKYDPIIGEHIERIVGQLSSDPSRFAIGEAALIPDDTNQNADTSAWYPPNAFHTYWTLEVLRVLNRRFPSDYASLNQKLNLEERKNGMLLWARRTLGFQLSLHYAKSSALDSDQLGWALAILLKFDEGRLQRDLAEQDLLRGALDRLFSTQLDNGTWRHYRSLFHYTKAGNAYCYVFETFAVLLGIALEHDLFRDSLFPHAERLIRLWRYAESTRLPIEGQNNPSVWGWCSSHRTNQSKPESWATASVYSFAQALRRLYGIWTRDVARSGLNRITAPKREAAMKLIQERGQTWMPEGKPDIAQLLLTMFVNPVLKSGDGSDTEPDVQPIKEDQARSAILFGPPGTSKTTLCRCIAGAIGWQYIELHASHFVSDGLNNVQKTADGIFQRLMEIDHAVVLFDEIDELVRERDNEHDAFGRFLTTSMLPKLAELWKQRKILYFVATNHIEYFDAAITRSQRFDALLLVPPPSFESKIDRLTGLVSKRNNRCEFQNPADLKSEIWTATVAAGDGLHRAEEHANNESDNKLLTGDELLAKFILLRYDQLDELAMHLADVNKNEIGISDLTACLEKIADRKLDEKKSYVKFCQDLQYSRRDHDKTLVWQLEGIAVEDVGGFVHDQNSRSGSVCEANGKLWLSLKGHSAPPERLGEFQLKRCDGNLGVAQYGRA